MTLKWIAIVLAAGAAIAQSQTQFQVQVPAQSRAEAGAPAHPAFEAASIKPSAPGNHFTRISAPPGRFNAENISLRFLIGAAWNIRDFQLSGLPGWASVDTYDVTAVTGGNTDFEQVKPMLQTLLEDRFRLKFHRETKDLPAYSLVPAKGGATLRAAKEGSCVTRAPDMPPPAFSPGQKLPDFCGAMRMSPSGLDGSGISMQQFTTALSNILQRTVTDRSGLTGTFNVHMEWTADQSTMTMMPPGPGPVPPPPSDDAAGGSIFTVIQEQLGLRLEPSRAPGEVFVVDRVEKPSEN